MSFQVRFVFVEWMLMVHTREMVSLIPRLSSFAVSGTPARTKVADLIHVLKSVATLQLHEK
jgi:hypothetical protein